MQFIGLVSQGGDLENFNWNCVTKDMVHFIICIKKMDILEVNMMDKYVILDNN
jgi:hypothetical protein